ncbi:MAG: UDP-N-acetylglucosamine 1-carboxyvinyltransferase [Candidatus Liptonbacteria bacterium]|nr:UDP-N-acetylglucosamine 1-carboxyvinyltransferase [Candidatus Liptonbacteria bacterium]
MGQERLAIGKFIAELREERGITQGALAKTLHTSQSAIARMEAGRQNFSTEMLAKIGNVLGRGILALSKGISFEIEGGHKLSGRIEVKASKNSAVALLCASLLNRGKTILRSMPRIEEVSRIVEVLTSIGVSVRWLNQSDVEIVPPRKLKLGAIDDDAARKTRSIIMLMGPLMHLVTGFKLPYAGGCRLGKRSVQPHLYALEKLGLSVKTADGWYACRAAPANPGKLVMYENGNTPTENAIMAAARVKGVVEIRRAASNYMVHDLCHFLEKLGVRIEGIGTHTLRVHGVPDIDTDVEFWPGEDPIEAMTLLSIAATTNSPITIARCPIDFLDLELLKLEKMGMKFQIGRTYKAKNGYTDLVDIKCTDASHLVALDDKLEAHDDPGMNVDSLPYFAPIAASAKGQTLIHDFMYENRAIYYMELNKLGADITLADVHRAYINGPTKWRAGEVICPPALRPAVIILIAMLAARGKSMLRNVYSINRGYEDLAARLNRLGAKIRVVPSL